MIKFNEWVSKKETSINRELFQKHFKFQRPSDMLKALYTTNDKKKNNDLVDVINSRLSDLRKEIEDVSEEEKKFEEPDKIVDIVENIVEFNKQNQTGVGMLSRLPIP